MNDTRTRLATFQLPELPYRVDALEPFISARTLEIHHGRHHRAYVEKANTLLGDSSETAEAVIVRSAGDAAKKALFNNAAQAWNHAFYWKSLHPKGGRPPREFAPWPERLKAAALGHFASGWAWLVLDGDKLKITSLHDADTPAVHEMAPLLTLDVWEHAYYIDYRNERPKHIQALLDNAINWEFVAQNLDGNGVSRADQ